MKPTSCFARGVRFTLVVLFALAPVLSARTCDCCERGTCGECCPWTRSKIACCCEDEAAESPSCCSSQANTPGTACTSVGRGTAGGPCRCMLEPKELWSASKDLNDLWLSDAKPPLIVTNHPAVHCMGGVLAGKSSIAVHDSGSPPPHRPARILFGVWRN